MRDRVMQDEVEVGVVIEVDGKKDRVAGDGEGDEEERFHLNAFLQEPARLGKSCLISLVCLDPWHCC